MRGLNLIVSCSKRKRQQAGTTMKLRDLVGHATIEERAEEWVCRLKAEQSDLIAARDLYCGDHWSVVRSIAKNMSANRRPIRVWICSAGYGLITPESSIAPYDATFSSGHSDSVVKAGLGPPKKAAQVWWRAIGNWNGPRYTSFRSISAVADSQPDDFFLVALSVDYLAAVSDDLQAAARSLGKPDSLAVICAGATTLPGLDAHLLPCDARLQAITGGAFTSLNVRLAALLLEQSQRELSLPYCQSICSSWMGHHPRRVVKTRLAMTDQDVRGFICGSLAENPTLRPTRLLHMLRKQGGACEHSRFVSLFKEVRGVSHAS